MIELKIEKRLYRFGMTWAEAQDFINNHQSWKIKIENGTSQFSMDNSDLWCLIKESALRPSYIDNTVWTKEIRWELLEVQGHGRMLMDALTIDSFFRSEFIGGVLFNQSTTPVAYVNITDILKKTERKETMERKEIMTLKMLLNSEYGTVAMVRQMLDTLGVKPQYPKITRVIFNDPATIVFWSDGDKTIVKYQEGDVYSPETGIAYATMKKFLGTNATRSNYISKDIKKQVEEWYAKKEIKEDLINAVGNKAMSYGGH